MLRYYWIYAKHHKQEKKLRKCVSVEKQRFIRSIQDWRQSILLSFGYDPLCCSKCGTSMLVLEVYHKKNFINNVMANPTHSLFCHVIFYFQFIIVNSIAFNNRILFQFSFGSFLFSAHFFFLCDKVFSFILPYRKEIGLNF